MPMITPNFEEGTLQPGTYTVRIKTCQQKTSQQGNPYLNWKFEVENGPARGAWVYHSTPFSGRGASLFKQLVQAAYDPNYESGAIDTDLLIDCALVAEIDRGNGKYMQVVNVSRLDASSGPNFGEHDPF